MSCKNGSELALIEKLTKYFSTIYPEDAIDFVFPIRRDKIKKQGKSLTNMNPLIPGHILISSNIEIEKHNKEIMKLFINAFGLLKYKQDDYKLKNSDIKFAQVMFNLGAVVEPSKIYRSEKFEEGRIIKVLSGPLKDITGRIVSVYKNTKVKVEVEFMGGKTFIQFPVEIVDYL